jgi:hypothetical protein
MGRVKTGQTVRLELTTTGLEDPRATLRHAYWGESIGQTVRVELNNLRIRNPVRYRCATTADFDSFNVLKIGVMKSVFSESQISAEGKVR